LVRRIEVHADHVRIRLPADRLTSVRERLAEGEAIGRVEGDRTCRQLLIPMRLKQPSGRSWIEGAPDRPRQPDPALVSALRQAHAMMTRDARGLPTLDVAPTSPYSRKLIRLALLAPDLQKQILDGRQPHGLTVTQLIGCDLPLSWPAQRAMIHALATTAAKS
jgi:site-specific DNA recombinase